MTPSLPLAVLSVRVGHPYSGYARPRQWSLSRHSSSTEHLVTNFFTFPAIQHPVEVCPLSREVMLPYGRRNPYPPRYETAFAFSTILYPQSYRLALRLAFPKGGELRAYHVPLVYLRGLGPSSTPGVLHLR